MHQPPWFSPATAPYASNNKNIQPFASATQSPCPPHSLQNATQAKLAPPPSQEHTFQPCSIPKPKPILFECMLLNYHQLLCHPNYQAYWTKTSANKFGQLANGVDGCVKGINKILFVSKKDIPRDHLKDIMYGQFCDLDGSSTLRDNGHLQILPRHSSQMQEFIWMGLTDIPEELYKSTNCLNSLNTMIVLRLYGLPHAELIANVLHETWINKHVYLQNKLIPGLWIHDWAPIWFTLVVDDFCVKYIGQGHEMHLKSVLES
eukprot:CCRYP_019314-RA/>CCRYP_019314-RA protein AED:0.58 eAED:0.43 QI:0/0/0/0.75/0/0/4/0/260